VNLLCLFNIPGSVARWSKPRPKAQKIKLVGVLSGQIAKNGKKGAGEKLKFAEKVLFSKSNKLKLKYSWSFG
jgi:hypothetical protein